MVRNDGFPELGTQCAFDPNRGCARAIGARTMADLMGSYDFCAAMGTLAHPCEGLALDASSNQPMTTGGAK